MDKPLRRPALSKEVRDYIKQYILENDLKGGDPLPPENQLVEELGVGRSSVREAIKSLQSLGIVESRRGYGLFVREYNMDPILETLSFSMRSDPVRFQELLRIRIWLETGVIREAVQEISDESIAELEAIMNAWQERVGSEQDHIDLDKQFHIVLYDSVNNFTLLKLFEVFWTAFEQLRLKTITEGSPDITINQHLGVLEAVKLREPELAAERLIEHFDYVIVEAQRAVTEQELQMKVDSEETNN